MGRTRTGGFAVGFRRGRSEWQKDLGALLDWARAEGFAAVDLGRDGDTTARNAVAAGFRVGSVDLAEWQGMLSPDKGRRAEAIARNAEYIGACAACGPLNHLVVMLPERPDLARATNFGFMVESFSELAAALERHRAHLAIEGCPGPGALCCTPEGYRAFFRECRSEAVGINYDPSHLVRMGIDPLRFLREFAGRVRHLHGKDTRLSAERLYELGTEQPPTFAKPFGFGGGHWRYTIPGRGSVCWGEVFTILKAHGYEGCVSVELEDQDFNGAEETEKLGLSLGRQYLEGC
jgi:sugar phosphate isomerase/epimerase